MKLLIFSILIFLCTSSAFAQQTRHEKRLKRYQSDWQSFIPTHMKIHYAGSMGLFSIGTGWDYGKRDQWETDLIFGFVPKYTTNHAKMVFTLKQNYIPWINPIGNKGFFFEPLTCGLYVSTISGREFWSSAPDKYPSGYYTFSTKLRFNIFAGERITYRIPENKRFGFEEVALFYEISTCDLYLISGIQNNRLKVTDYLKLSFGLKFQFF